MFVVRLFVYALAAMQLNFHRENRRHEVSFSPPVTVLKCDVAISPEKRNVLREELLPKRELAFVLGLLKTGSEKRAAFVCCEYFLQASNGRTVGIMIDHDNAVAIGFDLGNDVDAKQTHSKHFHNLRLIRNRTDQKRMYVLVHEILQDNKK